MTPEQATRNVYAYVVAKFEAHEKLILAALGILVIIDGLYHLNKALEANQQCLHVTYPSSSNCEINGWPAPIHSGG